MDVNSMVEQGGNAQPERAPIVETETSVSYLGVTLPKAQDQTGPFVPGKDRYKDYINDPFSLTLQKQIAVSFAQGDPVLVEGGTSIGKTTTVRKMAADLGWEVHYVNLNGATDVDDLMGKYIPNHNKRTNDDSDYIFNDGKVTSGLRSEEGKVKVIILDEYNFAAPNILPRLHEVLDAFQRGENVVLTEDASETIKADRTRTKVIALTNPPGKGYFGREPLDPAQLRRWVYVKAPTDLPDKSFSHATEVLFSLAPQTEGVSEGEFLNSRDQALLPEQLGEIPGIEEIVSRYEEFHKAAKQMVKERIVAEDQPQKFTYDDRVEPRRVRDFILSFYNGDINGTVQKALRYYYSNKLESPVDRQKLEEQIRLVEYTPPVQESKRIVLGDILGNKEEEIIDKSPRTGRMSEIFDSVNVRNAEARNWKNFLGLGVEVPNVPESLRLAYERAQKEGWRTLEPHYLPFGKMPKDAKFPGWKVKPEDWYWEQIAAGKLSEYASELKENWVLVDTLQKPDYDNGKQMYKDDPLAKFLGELRVLGKISTTGAPNGSRFDVSWDEIQKHVNPAIAALLGVDPSQVRLPREIEFNVLGNMYHPEWGKTSTYEWLDDKFGDGSRLIGGSSGSGGLAYVSGNWPGLHYDSIGFRPLIVFPT